MRTMKILLLGFPVLKKAFLQCGHEVLTCTTDQCGDIWIEAFPVSIDRVLQSLPRGWSPDLVFLMDESTEPMFFGLERLAIPTAWYTIDAHLHLHWHKAYAAVFDFVFVAQKDYVLDYTCDPSRQAVTWLPLFSDLERDCHCVLPKIYDLSFVGVINSTWKPERSRLLEAVGARTPLYTTTGEYVSVFNRSKVVLNECAANDVNFRIFEALACGSLLLTEHVGNGFDELFQDRKHLVMYDRSNINQIVELAQYYAHHKQEREAIAYAGREVVLKSHSTVHRAQTITEIIQTSNSHKFVSSRQAKLSEVYELLTYVYEHAAGIYEVASQRHQQSALQFRECVRMHTMYQDVRRDALQRLRGHAQYSSGVSL
ncbi:MAG: hypothetical protein NPIRA02_02930 [Nitrospirales bacterium]|nr:MAG: hypothetical protein NPIRA02_02930 [Nitrospirales bacterium]